MTRINLIALTIVLGVCSSGHAALVLEQEPNNAIGAGFSQPILTSAFDSVFSQDIGDSLGNNTSTTIPHVTIEGTGDGTYDYYEFQVHNAGDVGIFDIDYGLLQGGSVDIELALWNSTGGKLAENDDFAKSAGAAGSSHQYDSFIEYPFPTAGIYVVGVAEYFANGIATGWTGGTPDTGDTYTLQISLPVPEPSSGGLAVLALCWFGVCGVRRP